MKSLTKMQAVPSSETMEDPQKTEAPGSRTNRVIVAFNLLALLVVAGLSVFTMMERRAIRTEIFTGAAQLNDEMEALRVDVVTSSMENNVFLKVMLLKSGIDKNLARDIAHSIVIRAREHHRDPDLILAIIDVESNFNPFAISEKGAVGLMQIMPMWRESLGIDRDLRETDTSINYGLKILAFYEKTYGSLEMALTVYNRGPVFVNADLQHGRNPLNGYAEGIMRAYGHIKTWTRP